MLSHPIFPKKHRTCQEPGGRLPPNKKGLRSQNRKPFLFA
jgi:hypothetical protein